MGEFACNMGDFQTSLNCVRSHRIWRTSKLYVRFSVNLEGLSSWGGKILFTGETSDICSMRTITMRMKNGISRPQRSQMSMNFVYEVGGSWAVIDPFSVYITSIVVIASGMAVSKCFFFKQTATSKEKWLLLLRATMLHLSNNLNADRGEVS